MLAPGLGGERLLCVRETLSGTAGGARRELQS